MVSLISDICLLDSVGNFVAGRREEGNYEENGSKNGLNGRNKGGIGQILLPSASASFRQLPRPVGRGGFVNFGFLSSRQCW